MTYREADKAVEVLGKAYEKTLTEAYTAALKDINAKIKDIYAKYSVDGKLSIETMSKADKSKITRLQKVVADVNEDLSALNRGRPQQMASMLTDAYMINYDTPLEVAQKIVQTALTWDKPNREQVFKAAISEMGKIGLEQNAMAVRIAIRRDITNAIIQGEGIRDMSKRIKKSLENNANDTVRIARTETTRITNEARQDAFTFAEAELGIVMRRIWVATEDGRTRPSHQAMDGVEVGRDERFPNGLLYPGEQGAPASEVINCRCTVRSRLVSIDGVPIDELN